MFRRPASAQSADAEALFNGGIDLMRAGKVAQACAAFDASNRIEPRAGTLIRLGECRERNQQLASAWSAYKDALVRVKDPRKREVATARVAALEPRLSHLTVSVSEDSRIEGLSLTRNGQPLDPALWNRKLPVDGGDYVIAARGPGREEWQITVHVATERATVIAKVPRLNELSKAISLPQRPLPTTSPVSQGTSIRVPDRNTVQEHEVAAKPPENLAQGRPMPPAPTAREIDPPPRDRIAGRRWAVWKPWVVIGGGVGVAAVGGLLDALAAHNFDAYDSEFVKLPCAAQGCTLQQVDQADPHLRSRLSRAQLEQQIAVAGFIAGGAAIAAGVTLLYLNQPQRSERDSPGQNAPGVAVVPVVSHDLVGVAVTVSR